VLIRLGRRREVAVPGLVHRTSEGDVEPDLNDLVVRTQDGLGHGGDPRVADQVDEAAELLRVDLYVVAAGTPADGPALAVAGLLEGGHDVLVHRRRPVPGERPSAGDDAVGVQPRHQLGSGSGGRLGLRSVVAHPLTLDTPRLEVAPPGPVAV